MFLDLFWCCYFARAEAEVAEGQEKVGVSLQTDDIRRARSHCFLISGGIQKFLWMQSLSTAGSQI